MNNNLVKFIEKEIVLPDSVYGHLDWTTGVIRINMSGSDYSNLEKLDITLQKEFYDTLTHELFHSIQICTCGYLYNYIYNISKDLWDETIFKIKKNDLLYNDTLIKNRSVYEKIKQIDEKDPTTNISIRDIVEGQAFLVHNIINNPKITVNDFESILIDYEKTDYSNTYRFLEAKIGKEAFYVLSAISYISLSFVNPVIIFNYLANGLIKYKTKISFDTIGKIIDNLIDEVIPIDEIQKFYGSPLKMFQNNKIVNHLFYEPTLKELYSNYSIEDISIMHINPFTITNRFQIINLRPLLFNSINMVIPNGFSSSEFKDDDELTKALLYYSYISYKVLNKQSNLNFHKPMANKM